MSNILPLSENIQELNEYLNPFPKADDIFLENQSWLKEHFLPLLSIDLGILNPEWQGRKVYMLNIFEPYSGSIGDDTIEYHNKFTSKNWLAFKVTDDNRYEFLGNEGFFPKSPIHQREWKDYELEHFKKQLDYYQKSQELFNQYGCLASVSTYEYHKEVSKRNYLDTLGGKIDDENYFWLFDYKLPSAIKRPYGKDIYYKGNPFYHIASVAAYNYGCDGPDKIILMYEPIRRIVLFTFCYS